MARGAWGWWSRDGRELDLLDDSGGVGEIEVRARGENFEWGPIRPLLRSVGFEQLEGGGENRILALEPTRSDDRSAGLLDVLLDWESLVAAP